MLHVILLNRASLKFLPRAKILKTLIEGNAISGDSSHPVIVSCHSIHLSPTSILSMHHAATVESCLVTNVVCIVGRKNNV